MNWLGTRIKELVLNVVYLEPSSFNRVKAGELTIEGGKVFIRQFSYFTRSFPRWLAAVSANCPVPDVRKFLASNIYEEEVGPPGQGSHYELLLRQGQALGLSREEIEETAAFPTTLSAVNALESMCRNRSWLEGLAVTSGLECINHPEVRGQAGVMILNDVRAWQHLGLSAHQLRSRTIHMEEDEKHVETALEILSEHAAAQELQEKILGSAHEAVLAFRMLMDGIGRAALPGRC